MNNWNDLISNIVDSASGDIDRDKLKSFALGIVDKLQDGKSIKEDALTLLSICCKLWKEKEKWKEAYYDIASRYDKHLDKQITVLKNISRKLTTNEKGTLRQHENY